MIKGTYKMAVEIPLDGGMIYDPNYPFTGGIIGLDEVQLYSGSPGEAPDPLLDTIPNNNTNKSFKDKALDLWNKLKDSTLFWVVSAVAVVGCIVYFVTNKKRR